jgi:hypothetical protein
VLSLIVDLFLRLCLELLHCQVFELFISLKSSTADKIIITDKDESKLNIKDLLRESNVRITRIIQRIRTEFASELLKSDSPDTHSLLPKLLFENAMNMRKLNDYIEGILMHTIQKLERNHLGEVDEENTGLSELSISKEGNNRWTC